MQFILPVTGDVYFCTQEKTGIRDSGANSDGNKRIPENRRFIWKMIHL